MSPEAMKKKFQMIVGNQPVNSALKNSDIAKVMAKIN